MLWLLSESWGQVTPSGVRLPLALTHETLGALVGARRPSVTLAVSKLAQDGAIVHQDTGWLLLEPPARPADPAARILPPAVADVTAGTWTETDLSIPDPTESYAALRDTVRSPPRAAPGPRRHRPASGSSRSQSASARLTARSKESGVMPYRSAIS